MPLSTVSSSSSQRGARFSSEKERKPETETICVEEGHPVTQDRRHPRTSDLEATSPGGSALEEDPRQQVDDGKVKTNTSMTEEEQKEAKKFKQVSWQGLAILMLVEGVALGTLSFPATFRVLGLVPGILITLGIGLIAMYTGLVTGEACYLSPTPVHHFSDLGYQMGGPIARELFVIAFVLILILVVGSHAVTGAIALSTIVDDPTICSLAWAGVTTAALFLLALPKTFHQISILGYVDFISLIAAVLICLIATGVRTSNSPGGFAAVDWTAFPKGTPSFSEAFLQVTNICFAFSYTIVIPSVFPELKRPHEYKYAIYTLGTFQMVFYTLVGCLGYVFVGQAVQSPLLLSAGALVSRIAFGVALPLIIISGSVNTVAISRYIHLRMFKNTRHQYISTPLGNVVWIGLVFFISVLAFVVAEAIPVFSDVLGIIASLFVSGFSFYVPALMWFFLIPKHRNSRLRNILLGALNTAIFLIGLCLLGAGIYATAQSIKQSYDSGSVPSPFSCSSS